MNVVLEIASCKYRREEQAIFNQLKDRDEVTFFNIPLSHLKRGKVDLPEKIDLLSGSIDFVHTALKLLDKEIPEYDSYPKGMESTLHRKIWEGTKKDITVDNLPLFIKPKDNCKFFTGFVVKDIDDPRYRVIGNNRKLYISEVVNFISEWRVYWVSGSLWQIAQYSGEKTTFDMFSLENIFNKLYECGIEGHTVFDVGLLENGELALVEVNDGYSVGLYNEENSTSINNLYTILIKERWEQLIK